MMKHAHWPYIHWRLDSRWLLLLSGIATTLALHLHRRSPFDAGLFVLVWLLALTLLLWACWTLDREQPHPPALAFVWDRRDTFLLLGVVVVAWGLRCLYLDAIPRTFHNDEAIMAVNAVRLLHEPPADPAAVDTQGYVYLWYYTLALSIRLFGETVAGARMLPALLGVLTVPAAYLFLRLLFQRRIALIASVLLATFHFHIHFSRLALNNVADPLLGLLIFGSLILGWRTQRALLFALAGVWLGLGLYLYTGARLFFILALVMAALWLVSRLSTWRTWLSSKYVTPVMMGVLGTWLVAAPIVQNILLDPKPFTTRFRRDGLTLAKIQQFADEQEVTPLVFLWEQVEHAALAFHYYPDVDIGGFYDRQLPLLGVVPGALMVLGMGVCLRHWRHWRFQLPLVWLALAILLGGILMVRPPSVQRYITLAPVLCLLMALGSDLLYGIANRFLPRLQRWWRLALVLLVVYVAADNLQRYFADYRLRETYGTFQSQAATVLAQHLKEFPASPAVVYVGEHTQPYLRSFIPRYFLGEYPRFGLPDITELDTIENQLVYSLPANSCVVFVATPDHQSDLQTVEQRRPQGQWMAIHWPLTGELLFHVYASECRHAEQAFHLSHASILRSRTAPSSV